MAAGRKRMNRAVAVCLSSIAILAAEYEREYSDEPIGLIYFQQISLFVDLLALEDIK